MRASLLFVFFGLLLVGCGFVSDSPRRNGSRDPNRTCAGALGRLCEETPECYYPQQACSPGGCCCYVANTFCDPARPGECCSGSCTLPTGGTDLVFLCR
jgi:hypothetical protein